MSPEKLEFPKFGMSGHILYDLISSFPEAAHLKDTKTKRYLHSNKNNLKVYGLHDPNKVIGLTVHDLDEFMRPYWGNSFANKVSELDTLVAKERTVITDKNRVFLDKHGLVHVQDMTKAPITSGSDQVTAVFTMSFEITEKLDKILLFNTYRKIYGKKREACFYFMNHLGITIYFRDVLSEKEVICLLHMLENKSYKYIANKMNISLKTVETHISNIGNKTSGKTLSAILEFLRVS